MFLHEVLLPAYSIWALLKPHFLLGLLLTGSFKPRPNPAAVWLPDSSWQQLLRLSALPAFAGLAEAVTADPAAWQAVYDAAEPHRERLPGIYNLLGDFRKLLVVR